MGALSNSVLFACSVCVLLLGEPGALEAEHPGRTFASAMTHADLTRFARVIDVAENSQPGLVYCDAMVRSSGHFTDTACFAPNGQNRALGTAVIRAVSSLKVTPAHVDGRPVDAHVQFSVVLAPDETLKVVLNYVTNVEAIETERVSPQRIGWLEWADKYQKCSQLRTEIRCYINKVQLAEDGHRLTLEVDVGHDGQGLACWLHVEGTVVTVERRDCRRLKFVPGYLDGRPTPMRYFELTWR